MVLSSKAAVLWVGYVVRVHGGRELVLGMVEPQNISRMIERWMSIGGHFNM